MKRINLLLIIVAVISLQGCVTITSEIDGEEAIGYEDGVPVTSEHPLFEAVQVGKVEGFKGTSFITLLNKVSPNLDNEGARIALEGTLSNAQMLANKSSFPEYTLNAIFIKNNEEGLRGNDSIFIGEMNRKTEIKYTLEKNSESRIIFESAILSEGGVVRANIIGSPMLKEKETAVPSYKNNFTQVVNELKKIE